MAIMMENNPFMSVYGDDAEDDNALEDIGFFTLGKPEADEAQQALNELGLVPSPPRRPGDEHEQGRYGNPDEVGNMPFDLDHELDLEEMDRREEESQPTPYDLEKDDEDERLEGNGLLDEMSSPVRTPPDISGAEASVQASLAHLRDQASASTSKQPAIVSSSVQRPQLVSVLEEEDDNLGINGLPKYIPAGVTHVALLDGSTACLEKRKRVAAWKPKPAHYGAGPIGLLSRPVHQIVDRVEAMASLQVAKDSEAAQQFAARPRKGPEMWQEKFRPIRFTELIGEERTHREVMSWIKSWDKCVFGRRNAGGRKRFREPKDGFGGRPNVMDGPEVYKDKYDRPRERILLLGGPAGMGKTTLAHVAARTSGYLVHEINASDDRTAKTVEDRVRDALESNSLQASSSRQPTCLILDEVDGATGGGNAGDGGSGGGGFIKALIRLIEQGGHSGSASKKRGSKKQRSLLRPIICVCNDPYAASLRALRPYSKLVRLNRPSTPALMARLRQICELEGIYHDTAGLNMLVGLCQGDMRSCLNALQLVQSDPRGVTMAVLQGGGGDANGELIASALGIKDSNSSVHQVWTRLLRTSTSRERDRQRGAKIRAINNALHDQEHSSESHEVVSSLISSGEMDKILAGCFEHYPNLKLVDDGWWRFRKMHDWIHWYEYLNQRGWETGNPTEMWGYLPWSFVCWRQLFANTANELPAYPRVDYQNHLRRTAFDEMAADVQANLPTQTRSQFDKESLVTELGPMLVPLLTPNVKPINSQLVRLEEKATMTSCVALLHALNIDFVLDKNEQGHSYYRFDPPLEAFAHFEGKRVEGHTATAARYNVRQMMTSELRALRVRQRQGASVSGGTGAGDKWGDGESERARKGKAEEPQQKQAPKSKCAVDFFGRPITAKAENKVSTASGNGLPESILARRREKENIPPGGHPPAGMDDSQKADMAAVDFPPAKRAKLKVFYHFHEGYSNAVRKPIKMSALLS